MSLQHRPNSFAVNNYAADPSYKDGSGAMVQKNERVELEMKIMKARQEDHEGPAIRQGRRRHHAGTT
jgi:hypothetical protein